VTKVVAIDGPAGAGKSTLAQAVADHLGLERLDTGAMYRAVAWQALSAGIDPADDAAVAEMARRLTIEVGDRVTVDGQDVTGAIRTAAVDRAVSAVAANPEVRPPWSTASAGGWASAAPGWSRDVTSAPWCSPTPT